MCGRTVCSLAPAKLCNACQYVSSNGKVSKPIWKDFSDSSQQYFPSYNFCPDNFGPVLLSGEQFQHEFQKGDRVIHPMKWGLVPAWAQPSGQNYKMINARSDTLLEKRTFQNCLKKGQRCVVVADGFYEWADVKGQREKQAYFIHMPQTKVINWEGVDDEDNDQENDEWTGRRLMFMAALFDVNHHFKENIPLYSYTIITVDTSANLAFMHDRMPAVLTDDEAVANWLNVGEVKAEVAVEQLVPYEHLEFFKVSKNVNHVGYKNADCVHPFNENDEKKIRKHDVDKGSILKYFTPLSKNSPSKHELESGEDKCVQLKKIKNDDSF